MNMKLKKVIVAIPILSSLCIAAQTTNIEAKKVIANDSIRINGKWVKSVITDTSLTGATSRDIPSAAAIKAYVANRATADVYTKSASDGRYLQLSGGTMSGTLNMNGSFITNAGYLLVSGTITAGQIQSQLLAPINKNKMLKTQNLASGGYSLIVEAVPGTDYAIPSTSLSGYGITDAYDKTTADGRYAMISGSYSNPSWITSLAYSKLTGAPTNVSSFYNDAYYASKITDNVWTSRNVFYSPLEIRNSYLAFSNNSPSIGIGLLNSYGREVQFGADTLSIGTNSPGYPANAVVIAKSGVFNGDVSANSFLWKTGGSGKTWQWGNDANYSWLKNTNDATTPISISNSGHAFFTGNVVLGNSSLLSWGTAFRALQLGPFGGIMFSNSGVSTAQYWTSGAYFSGSSWTRSSATYRPSHVELYNGEFQFYTAAVGSANTGYTPTRLFKIDAAGTISTKSGTTSNLPPSGTEAIFFADSGGDVYLVNAVSADGNTDWHVTAFVYCRGGSTILVSTIGGGTNITVTSSGNAVVLQNTSAGSYISLAWTAIKLK